MPLLQSLVALAPAPETGFQHSTQRQRPSVAMPPQLLLTNCSKHTPKKHAPTHGHKKRAEQHTRCPAEAAPEDEGPWNCFRLSAFAQSFCQLPPSITVVTQAWKAQKRLRLSCGRLQDVPAQLAPLLVAPSFNFFELNELTYGWQQATAKSL